MSHFDQESYCDPYEASLPVAEVMIGGGSILLFGVQAIPKALEAMFTHDLATIKASTVLAALAVTGYYVAKHGMNKLNAIEQAAAETHERI